MKKRLLFVFVWLTLIAICGGGLLFAGPRRAKKSAEGSQEVIVPVLPEVKDELYTPNRNPNARLAMGRVYAVTASPLAPEPERLPPPAVAISGVKGVAIKERPGYAPWEPVDIVVLLPAKETFSKGILEGEDVSDWIPNLPDGLEARAHGLKKGATLIRIYISGTPTVTAREQIRVNIPGTYLTSGTARQFVSPTEQESFDSWKKSQTE